MDSSQRNNILTGALIVIIVIIAYIWYSNLKSGPDVTSISPDGSSSGSEASLTSKELLGLLAELEATKIDTSFFKNPLFENLEDTLSLEDVGVPEPTARANPFLPLP